MREGRFHGFRMFKIFIVVSYTVLRSRCLDTNVALGKPTLQSSNLEGLQPGSQSGSEVAVDGATYPDYGQGSCTHTNELDTQPWWLVDLKDIYLINYLAIYNRDIMKERLDNLIVEGFLHYPLLTSQAQPHLCAYNSGPSGDIVNLPCSEGTKARYIRLRGPPIMTLCEVEIFGEKADDEVCMWGRIDRQAGRQIPSGVVTIDLGHADSSLDCTSLCLRNPLCHIFNYNVVNGDCKLSLELISNDMVVSNVDWDIFIY